MLKRAFAAFELVHVPREQNARADLLAKLASLGKGGRQRTVIQETLKTPRKFVADNRVDVLHVSRARGNPRNHRSLSQDTARASCISTYAASPEEGKGVQVCGLEEGDTWMTPYRRYLVDGILPAEPEEGKKIKRNAARYTLVYGILFRHGFTHPILTCVSGDEFTRIIRGRKILGIQGNTCRVFLANSNRGLRAIRPALQAVSWHFPLALILLLQALQRSIYSSWPFHTWGIDSLGPFPLAIRQMKYLIVAIEYFTKWIEAEPVAQVTAHKEQHFVWKNIVCRFGVPRHLTSDNGTQFASQELGKLCTEVEIKQVFASVEHTQTNGQVKSTNRVLLRGLKRRLEKAKGAWAEEVPRIVWAYHTMPQSSTMETPFSLVYGSDAVIPVEIHESSPRFLGFVAEESNEERRVNLDLIDEDREEEKIRVEAVKRRVEHQYSSKVKLRQFQVGDLVMSVPSRIRALTVSRSKSTNGESKSTQGVA